MFVAISSLFNNIKFAHELVRNLCEKILKGFRDILIITRISGENVILNCSKVVPRTLIV